MERSFATNLSDVRVYTGGTASQVTRTQGAQAVAVGNKIAFAPGQFSPNSESGQHLLAHELTHVLQQRHGQGAIQASATHTKPNDAAEREADTVASAIARGEVAQVSRGMTTRQRLMCKARMGAVPSLAPSAPALSHVNRKRRKPQKTAQVIAIAGQRQRFIEKTKVAAVQTPPQPSLATAPVAPPNADQKLAVAETAPAPKATSEQAASKTEAIKQESKAKGAEVQARDKRSPRSPAEDPAFQAVVSRAQAVARKHGRHSNSAQRKAQEAQSSAEAPSNELAAQAGAAKIDDIHAQEPTPFDRDDFKSALMDKIHKLTPKTLGEAAEFKDSGKADQLKPAVVGQVQSSKDSAQNNIKTAADRPLDESKATPKLVVPMPPTVAGPPPGNLGALRAAPKPKTDVEVEMGKQSAQSLDGRMATAAVTEDQLANSNEAKFQIALAAKENAEGHSAAAPVDIRRSEGKILAIARGATLRVAAGGKEAMHGTRQSEFGAIATSQETSKTDTTAEHTRISTEIEKIYDQTKVEVDTHLRTIDTKVKQVFDAGADWASPLKVDTKVMLLRRVGSRNSSPQTRPV